MSEAFNDRKYGFYFPYFLFYSLCTSLELNFIGRITASELISAIVLPYGIIQLKKHPLQKHERHFFWLLMLWLFGAIVTDFYMSSLAEDYLRGWAKIVFFGMNFFAIRTITQLKFERVVLLVVCLALASAFRLWANIDGTGLGTPVFGAAWKFGYGFALATVIFYLAGRFRNSYFFGTVILALSFLDSLLNLGLNARNLFAITAAAAALNLCVYRRTKLTRQEIGLLSFCFMLFAAILVNFYSFSAASGYLGQEAEDKYVAQSSGSLGLILGGRSESIASTAAIADSPILGHGSWARDSKYVEIRYLALLNGGYEIGGGDPFKDDLIPTHSHLLGSWVEAGICGAIFWIWVAWLSIRRIYRELRQPSVYAGLVFLFSISFIWDIFFSPFGLDRRVIAAAWVALLMAAQASPKAISRKSPQGMHQ